jgi:hypothetical protein
MENHVLTFTETITVYAGVRFAEVSMTLQSKVEGISFDWIHVPFLSRGTPTQYANSIGFVDSRAHGLSQMIFPEDQLGTRIVMNETPNFFELVINLEGKSVTQTDFFAGFCPYQSSESIQDSGFQDFMVNNSETYLDRVSDLPLAFFNYREAINDWNISHIVVTGSGAVSRFAVDPFFNLVYKNDEVAIFRVSSNSK